MARLDTMPEPMHSHLAELPCPTFYTRPWVSGPPLYQRRVAIISTAGVHRRDDRPFEGMSGDFRVIPNTCTAKDLVMTHLSTNFDRTGFQQDWNVVFPLDRIRELAYDSTIGSVADFPHDVPIKADTARDSLEQLACPVSFAGPATHETETEKLLAAFKQELSEFRSWYDIGLEKRGYSSVVYFPPDAVLQVFIDFLSDTPMTLEENMSSPASALRFAAQDLKSIYFESMMFRPDMVLTDDAAFTRWF